MKRWSVWALAVMACGAPKKDSAPRAAVGAANGAATGAAAGVESTTTPAAAQTTGRARLLFLGTSLTAGLGLDPDSAYPAIVGRLAAKDGFTVEILNAGLSGETSAGALRRADWLLTQRLAAVIIETGANDGLRGLNPDSTAANIAALIAKARAAQPTAAIVLMQMEAPTNLGPSYQRQFHAVFPAVATKARVRLLPFLLDGVAGKAEFNQDDGIHPNPEGARRVAANVYRGLKPVMDSLQRQ